MQRRVQPVRFTNGPTRAMRRLIHLVALFTVGAACLAQIASADSTVTKTVAPGGTISTGSEATPADPILVTVTSKQGGTYRIDTITDPKRTPLRPYSPRLAYEGPQVLVVPPCGEADPGCQPFATNIVIDSSVMPAPGNGLFGVIGKDRLNTKAEFTGFCVQATEPVARCYFDDPLSRRENPAQPRHTMLPDGDVSIAISGDSETNPNFSQLRFDFGHPPSRIGLSAPGTAHLDQLFAGDIDFGVICSLTCTTKVKLAVSSAIARKYHLGSTTIAAKSFGAPGFLHVKPSSAVKRKLAKAKRVTVTTTAVTRDDSGKTATDTATTVLTPGAQDG